MKLLNMLFGIGNKTKHRRNRKNKTSRRKNTARKTRKMKGG